MNHLYIDTDGVPVFSKDVIDIYGFPEHYGVEIYRVIDSRHANMQSDYKIEHERFFYKIHRYDRLSRFKSTLYLLLGENGSVPNPVILLVEKGLDESDNLWNDIRMILKTNNLSKYYDHIPFIIQRLGYGRLFNMLNAQTLDTLIKDFKQIADKFDRSKSQLNRRYFPNLRFIVFKLLEAQSIYPNYKVPFTRTPRKNVSLNLVWDFLYN